MAISPCLGEENQNGKTADPETGKWSALYSSRKLEQNTLPTLPYSILLLFNSIYSWRNSPTRNTPHYVLIKQQAGYSESLDVAK